MCSYGKSDLTNVCWTDDADFHSASRGLSRKKRLWTAGQTIAIAFMGGTEGQKRFVRRVASLWLPFANLKFKFGAPLADSDVRVAFVEGNGSWSFLGTDARGIPTDRATMNFGWLPDDPSYHTHRGVVLHEFGHMLNLSHEHQSPRNDLTWDEAQIIADMARSGWDEQKTRGNIINRVQMSDDLIVSDFFDTKSVMSYSFPATWNLEGVAVERSSDLSREDKRIIEQMYPFGQQSCRSRLSLCLRRLTVRLLSVVGRSTCL